MSDLDQALETVKAAGYVVLKAKSYRQAQERQRCAEVRAQCEAEAAEHARLWARDAFTEQRRLADRLTFVYGVARAKGATDLELVGLGTELPDEVRTELERRARVELGVIKDGGIIPSQPQGAATYCGRGICALLEGHEGKCRT